MGVDQRDGCTALIVAASTGRIAVLNKLVSHGASLELSDKDGNAPLSVSASHGHFDIVKALIDFQASVNHQNKLKETPVTLAAKHNRVEILKTLLEVPDVEVLEILPSETSGDVQVLLEDARKNKKGSGSTGRSECCTM